jgi:Ca-activated chloride channel homolog
VNPHGLFLRIYYNQNGRNMNIKTKIVSGLLLLAAMAGFKAQADVSVAWTAPPDGSLFAVGAGVIPIGQASASGIVGGTGLDLALVIDTSGSMAGTRIATAKSASIALVNALPLDSSSVAVIEYSSTAGLVKQLSPLTSDKAAIIAAINGLTVGGLTAIGDGIQLAGNELTGVRHTAGRSQQMVVLSDGFNNAGINPITAANNAVAAGVDQIHTVGVPGHSVTLMRNIAAGPDGIYGTADDYGVYTAGSLAELEGLFSGTGGNLVGISKVEVTMPDGTTQVVPTDGLGNFAAPSSWAIEAGAQTWVATAYDTAGNSAQANLTLYGQRQGVPDVGSTLVLLGLALTGLGAVSRRSKES